MQFTSLPPALSTTASLESLSLEGNAALGAQDPTQLQPLLEPLLRRGLSQLCLDGCALLTSAKAKEELTQLQQRWGFSWTCRSLSEA